MRFIRRLLVSDKNPPTYGELGGVLRNPRMLAVLACAIPPALVAYVLWARYIGPYYAVTGGIIGGTVGLAYLLWQVSKVASEDRRGDSSNS